LIRQRLKGSPDGQRGRILWWTALLGREVRAGGWNSIRRDLSQNEDTRLHKLIKEDAKAVDRGKCQTMDEDPSSKVSTLELRLRKDSSATDCLLEGRQPSGLRQRPLEARGKDHLEALYKERRALLKT
jgi:hypothetical protein